MAIERTFVMIKPDAVQRGLMGEIISRFEQRGLKPVAMKFMKVTKELAARHYAEHEGKPFYDYLLEFITSSPVLAMVWEGDDAISVARTMMGKTNPKEAIPGTIRGDFGQQTGKNIVHGSDGPESAAREIAIYFTQDEQVLWALDCEKWLFE